MSLLGDWPARGRGRGRARGQARKGESGFFLIPVCVLISALVAGCSPAPVKPGSGQLERQRLADERRQQLAAHPQWKLFGRILATRAAQTADEDGRSWSGNLYWKQTTEGYVLRVSGPLGQGAFQIRGDASGVELTTSRKQTLHADSAQALLARMDAPQLPVEGLVYWARGLPLDGVPTARLEYDPLGRLQGLSQAGWRLGWDDYRPVDGVAMPGQVVMRHGPWRFELLVSRWTL